MNIELFDYDLPPELVAQEPLQKRDHSKLMVLERKSGRIIHRNFFQIPELFQDGDLLILNNSKVIPARLCGKKKKTGGEVEVLLIELIEKNKWKVLLKPGKRVHKNTEIIFSEELYCKVLEKNENDGLYVVEMYSLQDFDEIMHKIGKVPTPPYIKKELDNSLLYQTVYASEEGSIAAPTAGFHFTKNLLEQIKQRGIDILFLTLHIGRGTFEMIKSDRVEDHQMKAEIYTITEENANIINLAISEKRRIVGVGTSVTRALESSVKQDQTLPGTRWTDLFIFPGYHFKAINALLTNFHLPRSTPLMLASAFAGKDFLLKSYHEAIKDKYRFYSFGDSMFIID